MENKKLLTIEEISEFHERLFSSFLLYAFDVNSNKVFDKLSLLNYEFLFVERLKTTVHDNNKVYEYYLDSFGGKSFKFIASVNNEQAEHFKGIGLDIDDNILDNIKHSLLKIEFMKSNQFGDDYLPESNENDILYGVKFVVIINECTHYFNINFEHFRHLYDEYSDININALMKDYCYNIINSISNILTVYITELRVLKTIINKSKTLK